MSMNGNVNVKTTQNRAHLFQKGNPGGGRPRGSVSLKARLLRLMNKDTADAVASTLIDMAIKDKNVQAIKLLAELTDCLSTNPQVNINNNTLLLADSVVERARKWALENIIDAPAIPVNDCTVKQLSPPPVVEVIPVSPIQQAPVAPQSIPVPQPMPTPPRQSKIVLLPSTPQPDATDLYVNSLIIS